MLWMGLWFHIFRYSWEKLKVSIDNRIRNINVDNNNKYWGEWKVWPCEHFLRKPMFTWSILEWRSDFPPPQYLSNTLIFGGDFDDLLTDLASMCCLTSFCPPTLDLYRFALAESSHSLAASIICLDLSWQWYFPTWKRSQRPLVVSEYVHMVYLRVTLTLSTFPNIWRTDWETSLITYDFHSQHVFQMKLSKNVKKPNFQDWR